MGLAAMGHAGQGSATAGTEGGTAAFAGAGVGAPEVTASQGAAPPLTADGAPGQGGAAVVTGRMAASVPEVLAYPKAGFWERLAAAFLDIVLILILGGLTGKTIFPLGGAIFPLVALAYFSGMWAWKGTSVGGIVLGLKVAREDNQPITFAVTLVRALAAAFSVIMCFLGFLWIAWDPAKQGWHDKIAGTVVLKLPHGTPLICV